MTRPVSDVELAGLIQTEIEQCHQWAGSEWREAVKQSLNYLLLRNKGDEVEGRSQVQSGDVADMLDHVQAEIQPMYAVDDLVEVQPEGPGDDEQAALETSALNWYFRERVRGFDTLDEAIQDGLLSRNGYLKVWYEESHGLPYEETIQGDRMQVDAALMEKSQECDIEVLEEGIVQEQVTQTVEAVGPDGITPVVADVEVAPAIFSIRIKCTPRRQEVKVASVAPEDMFISKDAVGSNMQIPRFVAHRRRLARMDVAALGFDPDQVDKMPTTATYETDVKTARKSDFNTYSRQGAHPSGQTVDLFEVYYRIDRDGDGLPEMWKCFYSSAKEILRYANEDEPSLEMVRTRPFASGSPMKVAHRHDGRSLYDKEKQIEDVKRALLRQMLDNLELGNDNGFVVGPTVEREDLEETDTVRYIRAGNPADLQPIPYTQTAQNSLSGLQYMDKMRRERGGASIDLSTESMPVNQAAHSTERIMSAMERLVAMYARNFARTLVRDTFVLLHQQLQLLPGKISFEAEGDWMETEPRFWIERSRISVTLGVSEGEKMRRAQGLMQVIQQQQMDAEGAFGILVDYRTMYEARVDLARISGLTNPSQYWVDPDSPEAQQAAQAQQEQAAQQQQMMAQQQQQMIQMQMQAVAMQEETKRLRIQQEALEAERDRVATMLQKAEETAQKYVEIELKYGQDVPEKGIEGAEVVSITKS